MCTFNHGRGVRCIQIDGLSLIRYLKILEKRTMGNIWAGLLSKTRNSSLGNKESCRSAPSLARKARSSHCASWLLPYNNTRLLVKCTHMVFLSLRACILCRSPSTRVASTFPWLPTAASRLPAQSAKPSPSEPQPSWWVPLLPEPLRPLERTSSPRASA